MGLIGDIFGGIVDIFGDAFNFLEDAAKGIFNAAVDTISGFLRGDLGDAMSFVPYVAAVAGYIYGGPAGAKIAYDLTGGDMPEFDNDILDYAAQAASLFSGEGDEGIMKALLVAGLGLIQTDEGSNGTTVGGVDIFSPDIENVLLKAAQKELANLDQVQRYVDWEDAGGAGGDEMGEAIPVRQASGRYYAEQHGIDYDDLFSILNSTEMGSSALKDAYLQLEAIKEAALSGGETGGVDSDPTSPEYDPEDTGGGSTGESRDDMTSRIADAMAPIFEDIFGSGHTGGGDGESGGRDSGYVDDIVSGIIGGILGEDGDGEDGRDGKDGEDGRDGRDGKDGEDANIDITTSFNFSSDPPRLPSIRSLEKLNGGLFDNGPLVRQY